jgi:hypothetical protein
MPDRSRPSSLEKVAIGKIKYLLNITDLNKKQLGVLLSNKLNTFSNIT